MPQVGDTLIKRFTITDATGSPDTGAVFDSVSCIDPLGGTQALPDPVHLGDGIYELVLPGEQVTAPGSYYARASLAPPSARHFEFSWNVVAAGIAERWKPGDTIMERFTVVDPLSDPIPGAEFMVTTIGPQGAPFPVAEVTNLGGGTYQVGFTLPVSARAGSYYVQLASTNLTPKQVFEFEWLVGRGPAVAGQQTLRAIRRMVMARFGDLVTAIATENGTESSLIDHDNLYGEPGRFAGRDILFLNGANAGQQRHIVGSSRDDSTIQFNRPLPYPTTIGDEADITNAYGLGVTFRAVRDAINYAIAVARQYHLTPMTYRASTPFRADADVIPVPVEMVGVERVEMVDGSGETRSVRRAHTAGGNGWSLDHPGHGVVLRGHEAQRADGWIPVIHGYTLPHDLVQEDDTTTVDIEWLVDMATSHLCLDTLLSRQASGEWGSKGMLYKQNAERTLSRLTPILRSSFTRFQ